MKKAMVLLMSVVMVIGMFSGCGNSSAEGDSGTTGSANTSQAKETQNVSDEIEESNKESDESQEDVEPIVMKFAHAHPADSPRDLSIQHFKELVEEQTEGRIKVEIYPAGQLGTEPEMVESLKMGTIEAVRAGVFDATATELMVYTMPFLFESLEDFQAICRGPLADVIAEATKEVGITVTATGDGGGFRQWSNNVRPIRTLDDAKGLKMRTPPIESIVQTMEAIGANPVSVPYVETYMGLKTGVADGQENPIINMGTMKFYEVQKYMTMVNYQVHPDPVYVNTEWLESLDEDLQEVIKNCSKEMMVYSDSLIYDAEATYMEDIENSMEIIHLNDSERAEFIEAAKVVWENFVEQDLIQKEHLDAILEELNK